MATVPRWAKRGKNRRKKQGVRRKSQKKKGRIPFSPPTAFSMLATSKKRDKGAASNKGRGKKKKVVQGGKKGKGGSAVRLASERLGGSQNSWKKNWNTKEIDPHENRFRKGGKSDLGGRRPKERPGRVHGRREGFCREGGIGAMALWNSPTGGRIKGGSKQRSPAWRGGGRHKREGGNGLSRAPNKKIAGKRRKGGWVLIRRGGPKGTFEDG